MLWITDRPPVFVFSGSLVFMALSTTTKLRVGQDLRAVVHLMSHKVYKLIDGSNLLDIRCAISL